MVIGPKGERIVPLDQLHRFSKAVPIKPAKTAPVVVNAKPVTIAPLEVPVDALTPPPKNRSNAPRSGDVIETVPARRAAIEQPDGAVIYGDDPWSGCPHCAKRREALRKATARHRAKKLGRPFEEDE